MDAKQNKCIFFRDDDIAELTENLKLLLNIFIANKVPVHLAVIPQKLTKECKDYLLNLMKLHKNLIEIGQHGLNHINHSKTNSKYSKYEFGKNRTKKDQHNDIVTGKQLLIDSFNTKINIFTPPWHGFDENTLKVLENEKFLGISLGRESIKNKNLYKLKYINVNIDFNKRNDDGNWTIASNKEITKTILTKKAHIFGILLHHNEFKSKEEFLQLSKLLQFLKNELGVKFTSLSKSKYAKVKVKANNINQKSLAYFLNYQFVPKPLCLSSSSINPTYSEFKSDYKPKPKLSNVELTKLTEMLHTKLKSIFKKQLGENNQPIGLLLSGGLDSSAILHTLRELTDRNIYTLTGAYSKNANNLIIAEKLSKKYHTSHQSLIIHPKDLEQINELYCKGIPQPIGDNGFLATYLMIKTLKKNSQNIFSGDGADCIFCGLQSHKKNITKHNNKFAYEHYQFGEIFLSEEDLKMAFEGKVTDINLKNPFKHVSEKVKTTNPINRQVLLDLNFLAKNRVDYILYAAKANNTEIKLPFLDRSFINFALKIPSQLLFTKSNQQKFILREAFKDKLPTWVLNRKKEGFTPPMKLWYYKNKEFVVKSLLQTTKTGISKTYIKYLIKNFKNTNNYEIGMKIWLLLNLAYWMKHNENIAN